ncbi:tetratricopeptide repeat protein, partial [Pararhodospirillum oryzae]|uniref:tetratricopeptide repeat protein n=1 Tax=Pararhodospirillum oryzae TaxID=478448 RepID=UPI0011BF2C2E
MQAVHDVFFSYASADRATADRVVAALKAEGLRVWFDATNIDDFADIERRIQEGLAQSKALVALYSRAYGQRRACDWELASALIAAGPDWRQRVLVINPEESAGHLEPRRLIGTRFFPLTPAPDLSTLARTVGETLAPINEPLGAPPARGASALRWVGLARNGGPRHFVGRHREIWAVHDGLAEGSVLLAPTTCGVAPRGGEAVVQGMGGIGKSLLAEEYARRFAAAWPGGVFWLRAGGGVAGDSGAGMNEARLDENYRVVARALGLTVPPGDPAALRWAVIRALEAGDADSGREAPYLWVVDDLPHGLDADQARAWLAPTGAGRTLITTRDRGLGEIARPIDLGTLPEAEALALLTLDRPPQGGEEQALAREIVTALGGHALAVDVARHLVGKRGYRAVWDGLRARDGRALELAKQLRLELPNGHDVSVANTLLVSLDLLSVEQLDCVRVAALGAPNHPVPLDFLARVRRVAAGRDPEADAAGETDAVFIAVDGVASHSLCEAADTAYQVHPLVCRTVVQVFTDARQQALREAMVEALRQVLPAAEDIRRHGALAALIPHAQALALAPQTEAEADVIGWGGRFYLEAGVYGAARDAFQAAVEARGRILGPEHPDTLTSQANLALTLHAQGDLAGAREMQEGVLEVLRRVLGPEHPNTLVSMNNLAEMLRAQGDLAGAREMQDGVLEVHRRVLGPEHPDTLTSQNNLAETLRAQGDLAGAREMQEGVLEVHRCVLGPEHPATLTS